METWKPIPSCIGYEASNLGNIRSFIKKIYKKGKKGIETIIADCPQTILSPFIPKTGYKIVLIYKDKKRRHKLVHRLVLEAFNGPCPPGLEACHNDGNRINNHIDNLRYDTRINNFKDKYAHGTDFNGNRNPAAKLTEDDVIIIRSIYKKRIVTYQMIAPIYGVTWGTIRDIIKRNSWRHI
jgi:hypothetical protein